MLPKLKILLLSLLVLGAIGPLGATNPPSASARWGICAFNAFGNYEFYALYPFCYSVAAGTGNAERVFPAAGLPASVSSNGSIEFAIEEWTPVNCSVAATTGFYNKEGLGKASVEKFALSKCTLPEFPECTVSVEAKGLPYEATQPIKKGEFFVLLHKLELPLTYAGEWCILIGISETITGNLEGVWANVGTKQLVFPEAALAGSSLWLGEMPVIASGTESFEVKKGGTVEAVTP